MQPIKPIVLAYSGVFLPDPDVNALEWAERHRRLVKKSGSALPGRYSSENAPYQREPLEVLSDHSKRRVILVWGAQTGKTDCILMNWLLFRVACDPANVLYVFPTEGSLDRTIDERWQPTIEGNLCVYDRLTEGKKAMSHKSFSFEDCAWYFGAAGSDTSLSSFPLPIVVIDEIDQVPEATARKGDFVELAEARQKNFPFAKTLLISTPKFKSRGIWPYYEDSDRRVWEVPCLSCGKMQVYEHEQLKLVDRPKDMSHSEIAGALESGELSCQYECIYCGNPHTERDKHTMNARGRWRATGQNASNVGFHISSLASHLFKWNLYLAAWFRACDDKDKRRVFINLNKAEPFEPEGKRDGWEAVIRRRDPALKRRDVPPWSRQIVVGVDYNEFGFTYAVRAIGYRRMHLVDAGVAKSMEELHVGIMDSSYGGNRPRLGGVDSRYNKDHVLRYCANHPESRMLPIMGEARQHKRNRYRETELEFSEGGRRRKMSVYLLDVGAYKDREWEIFEEERMTFFVDIPRRLAQEYMSEECIDAVDRNGFDVSLWQTKAGSHANHVWDACIYANAMADLLGYYGWKSDEDEAVARKEAQEKRHKELMRKQQLARGGLKTPDGRPFLVTER